MLSESKPPSSGNACIPLDSLETSLLLPSLVVVERTLHHIKAVHHMSQASEVFRAGVGEFRSSVVAASKPQTRD
jgi:hypothetical protein